MDQAFFVGERRGGGIGVQLAQAFEHVVHAGHGEIRMLRLPLFAERVETFAERAEFRFQFVGGVREGEGIECRFAIISRTVFQCSTGGQCP